MPPSDGPADDSSAGGSDDDAIDEPIESSLETNGSALSEQVVNEPAAESSAAPDSSGPPSDSAGSAAPVDHSPDLTTPLDHSPDLTASTPSQLWRAEEARVGGSAPAPESIPAHLWRPEEKGRIAPSAVARVPPPTGPSPTLWRTEEGAPVSSASLSRATVSDGDLAAKSSNGKDPSQGQEGKSRTRPRSLPARLRRIGVALVVLVVIAFAADIGFAGYLANRALREARNNLKKGSVAFRNGKTGAAADNFKAAVDDSRIALGAADQPALALLRGVPGVQRDAKSVKALAGASELVAKAGLAAANAGDVLGIDSEGLAGSIYRHGRVQFDVLERGSPFISTAAGYISEAFDLLDETPSPILGFIQKKVDAALDRIDDARTSAVRAETLVSALPSLLGEDTPRSYLLVFQALGEARGSGGVAGVYGILDTDGGRLKLVEVTPFTDTFEKEFPEVDAPSWFGDSYGPQSALTQWQQANVSPNFPAVAHVFLNMYEAETGDALDGVFALDPVAMADLMEGTGPIEVPQLEEPITADNVAQVLMHDSYLEFPKRADQNDFIETVVGRFWHKISSGKVNGPDLVSGLGEAAQTQHLKIFARDDSDQEAIRQLGVDGSYEGLGPNVQLVFGNNYAANKVDYFLHRFVKTTVQLDESGSAHVRTTVNLVNNAPAGPDSALLGPKIEGVPAGYNRTLLSILFPKGARPISLKTNGERGTPFEYDDDGYPVAWNVLDIPAGDTATMTLDYVVPDAADVVDGAGSLRFSLFPQTTYTPDRYRVRIAPPEGYASSSDDEDATIVDGYVEYSGDLEQPRTFSVDFNRP